MKEQYERRVMETKEKIFRAFLHLMGEKDIHQISISGLCRLAGINRSTFYHHFGSQYDVLTELTDDFLADLEEKLQGVSPCDREGVQHRVELCLDNAMQNRELTLLLMQHAVGTDFAQRLFSLPGIESLLREKLSDVESETERHACISFVTYGAYQLLREWLNEENPISTAEETELILTLARRVC